MPTCENTRAGDAAPNSNINVLFICMGRCISCVCHRAVQQKSSSCREAELHVGWRFFFVDRETCRYDGQRDNVAETRGQYVICKIRI